jgi:dihydropteroate synthase
LRRFAARHHPSPTVPQDHFRLDCRGRTLDLPAGRAVVMGILNVTPDSFSDGGAHAHLSDALSRAEQMLAEGAAILDVGGESTRPAGATYGAGAAAVPADEELRRAIPVIEALAEHFPEALLSVDTYKAEVAEAALASGAHIVNDVSGLRHGDALARAAARAGAPVVVMHARGEPGALEHERPAGGDVVDEVRDALAASVRRAEAAGVRDVIVDPGFGFGKTPRENLALLAGTDRLRALGRPVLVGISRKSTIGVMLRSAEAPAGVGERLFGTLGATAVAVVRGASIVRTHDVRPTVEMLRLVGETLAADPRWRSELSPAHA